MGSSGPVLKIHRMITVQVRPSWNSIGILGPESTDIVRSVQTERIRVFAKPVKIWVLWQVCPQSNVLSLKYDACCRSIEQDFSSLGSNNREREWRGNIFELEVSIPRVRSRRGSRAWKY